MNDLRFARGAPHATTATGTVTVLSLITFVARLVPTDGEIKTYLHPWRFLLVSSLKFATQYQAASATGRAACIPRIPDRNAKTILPPRS
jgi:hypothetical protein